MSTRDQLRRLADRVGILPEYLSFDGRERRLTSDRAREAILAALGFDASTEAAADRALQEIDRQEAARIVDPVCIAFADTRQPHCVRVRAPLDLDVEFEWSLEFHEESGETYRSNGQAHPMTGTRGFGVSVPVPPEIGCHRVRVSVRAGAYERHDEQLYVVAPRKCVQPIEIGAASMGGIWTSLYSIRSNRNWGCGDITDLNNLTQRAAACGADFILVNPLHCTRNRPPEISPYRPVSRLFRNPIYIDVEAVPELESCPSARRLLAEPKFKESLAAARASTMIDYARIWSLKREVLEKLHACFLEHIRTGHGKRARAYYEFLKKSGDQLREFGLFMALDEKFRAEGTSDWRQWPAEFRDAESKAILDFAASHSDEIDFRSYIQFELDQQLGDAGRTADEARMKVGVVNDLAIGAAPNGFDSWWLRDSFVEGVNIGAPPDDLGPTGQNWGLPPLNPLRLRDTGFAAWRMLLKAAFDHAGAIRIDHVMGLQRQFWIPQGFSGTDGAYIRFPADEMFAILAVESQRRNAIVVGEDLGTVPEGFEAILDGWGVLSTRALYFERSPDGEFRRAQEYPRRAMVSLNSHDMVPWAGFADGVELKLRHELGIIPTRPELQLALVARREAYDAVVRRLIREGLLTQAPQAIQAKDVLTALCRFLARTKAALVAISLDDLAGETTSVNVPGVGPDRYPSWSRRMKRSMEEIFADSDTHRLLELISRKDAVAAC